MTLPPPHPPLVEQNRWDDSFAMLPLKPPLLSQLPNNNEAVARRPNLIQASWPAARGAIFTPSQDCYACIARLAHLPREDVQRFRVDCLREERISSRAAALRSEPNVLYDAETLAICHKMCVPREDLDEKCTGQASHVVGSSLLISTCSRR